MPWIRFQAPLDTWLRSSSETKTTDVYLLGGILFQILRGRPPHLVGRFDDMLESIRVSEFDFPEEIPQGIASICKKALARDPAERYQSATAFADAVRNFLATQRARSVLADADDKLARLRALNDRESTEGAERFALYRLFSECKFGYGAISDVLETEARLGIEAAAELMVAYELDRGAPDAAEALLAEVGEVSPAVANGIARLAPSKQLSLRRSRARCGRSQP